MEKFAGDAVMAAFGIPQAHEDDAERAIRAGLAVLNEVHELQLEARIGVESGEVVADDSDSTFATGEAVTVAARLEQSAEPGQLLIGPAAHRLTLGRIEVDDVGPVEVRGREEPIWVWRAIGADAQAPAQGRGCAGDSLRTEGRLPSWKENERRYLAELTRDAQGRLYGPGGAAETAGLKPTTLRSKLLRHGLR